MSNLQQQSANTQQVIRDFVNHYKVISLDAVESIGISDTDPISHLTLMCLHEGDTESHEYKVDFKLTEQHKDIYQYLSRLATKPALDIVLASKAAELDENMLGLTLRSFFKFIEPRMTKAQQEEDIQSIPFVGNTFVLNRKTTFKVVADDGEGHLDIEIIGNPPEAELKLSAHGLMDGLYSGMIKEEFPTKR